ncbi:OmpA family protein [Ancylomarina sp. 16SWW S1-10-2]|uniref:OmpA family protein n=1 Tax=Ancylomarina sp. 16SWW S1-10-2 TaxID=2499681 RepID=UPI0012ADE63D|nr:OmpA family protein [Ancylomarina sp. 16SWW S1-10-2]MRT93142.1 OmpA family protein [Ancylomarina sp. 16SWW S1-10-2]
MKKLISIAFLIAFSFSLIQAQIVDPEKVVKKQGTRRANNKIEKGVDKGFDKLEQGIGSLFGKKKKKKNKQSQQNENKSNSQKSTNSTSGQGQNQKSEMTQQTSKKPNVVWNKFDFVPGDVVIFEDGPAITEDNGEFPSRWDLHQGGAEIAEVDGIPVITFITDIGNMHNRGIVPYLKNAKEDYLPEIFTIELDAYFNPNKYNEVWYLTFYDRKNQNRSNISQLNVHVNTIKFGDSEGELKGKQKSNYDEVAGWRHISIAYTKGKLKAYLDDQRLINIPHLEGNPTGITLSARSKNMYAKNIRIAKGGVKYYDRVLQDGKIICNGIRFDVNKASLKPESMGPINKIFELLQKQPNLNFSVEGHTDSDGDDSSNKSLSEARAKVVMEKLIQMGISSNRLSYAGYGESKPIDNNSTPEGKANNRRVEFVKTDGNTTSSSLNVGSSSSNSLFDALDRSAIDTKMNSLQSGNIEVANQSGVVLENGTTIIYSTSDGYLGKMEILNVDEQDNYKLTIRFVTYNNDGSVHSESNHLEIQGTYTCDLDKGKSDGLISSEEDFWLSRQGAKEATIVQREYTVFYVVPN